MSVGRSSVSGGALVIGGSGGLGAAVARALTRDGLDVAITYRVDRARAEALALELREQGVQVLVLQADLASGDAAVVAAAAEAALGGLRALVYAAGQPIPQVHISQVSRNSWRDVVQLDLLGFFDLVQASIPALRRSRGSLVAVTTTAVSRHAKRDILSSAPKAAVEALVRGIASEEGRHGVRANCVAPGMIEIGVGLNILQQAPMAGIKEAIRTSIPLGRFGVADEVAEAVAFLVSDRASYITGQVLAVDGGWQV